MFMHLLIDQRSFERARALASHSSASICATCERACLIWPRAEPSCAALMRWPPSHSDPEMNLAAGPPAESREVRLRSDLALREKVNAGRERKTKKQKGMW